MSVMDPQRLATVAAAWADADSDSVTADEVRALLSKQDWKELEDRFGLSLEFGTAGLRGTLGGGTNRMNRAVIRRTTAGLARYLKQHVPDVVKRGVVVGRDGRNMSFEFAQEAAQVFAAEGIPAHVFKGLSPTPVTAYALEKLNAAAAVMVTASHNPPEYNGFKVYWGNGAQIVPPHDVGIAKAIDEIGGAKDVALLDEKTARSKGLWLDVPESLEPEYIDAILALRPVKKAGDLSIVYTAMHGVGGHWAITALKKAGFTKVTPVAEQQEPDGAFPTVRFPNPEEKGAMDLSLAHAEKAKADIVLANDPDADRLAVMARDESGKLKMLTGNEFGVLLGHYMLTQHAVTQPLVITTIVSSTQLKAIATARGARFEETLTGFKWIANRALELQPEGFTFVMGYEEAIGYTVGELVRDKDGVGTAVVAADMAQWCKSRGVTLFGYLEEVQREYGLFLGSQFNATLPGTTGATQIRSLMDAFRANPITSIGTASIDAALDYSAQTRFEKGVRGKLSLPKSNVLAWELAGGHRVTLRPSGTEPKIKVYFEWRENLAEGESVATARPRAEAALKKLETDFLALARERGLP